MGTSRIRSRLVPKETAQKYGYKVLDWKEFVVAAIDTAGTTGGQLSATQGTTPSKTAGALNSIYIAGLSIDADNTGLIEGRVFAYDLWQADLTQEITLTAFVSTGNVAASNTLNFTTKYLVLDPDRTTGANYATGLWTAVATDFTAVTVGHASNEDNNLKKITGAIVPASVLTDYDQALAFQLTPAFGGSYADNTTRFDALVLRYTRRMV